ncbi:MAG: hypothetical protein P1P88_22815 [Bacteroidales bacterium]|nr:hypothetical protein [Bacteroidales bacterium]
MDKFYKNIDHQLSFNKGKNLFNNESFNTLKFIREITSVIEHLKDINESDANLLIDYTSGKAISEFWRINQYFSFDKSAKAELRNIYFELFSALKKENTAVDELARLHYEKLKSWLQINNAFAEKIYHKKDEILEPVTCAEYSAQFQIDIFQINLSSLAAPVLDIGCGEKANLVSFLNENGIEAFGIDRFTFDNVYLKKADWLEFEYGTLKWGTIISNLGFSNHFYHHHLREDGNYFNYARKYMDILNSLKVAGSFYYAPELPFIEQYLDKDKYQTEHHFVGELHLKATKILRIH